MTKQEQASQLRLAADILETGHPWARMRTTPFSEPSDKEIDALHPPPTCPECGEPVPEYDILCDECEDEFNREHPNEQPMKTTPPKTPRPADRVTDKTAAFHHRLDTIRSTTKRSHLDEPITDTRITA